MSHSNKDADFQAGVAFGYLVSGVAVLVGVKLLGMDASQVGLGIVLGALFTVLIPMIVGWRWRR